MVVGLHLGALLDEMAREPLLMPYFEHLAELLEHGQESHLGEIVQDELDLALDVDAGVLGYGSERRKIDVHRGERWSTRLSSARVLQAATAVGHGLGAGPQESTAAATPTAIARACHVLLVVADDVFGFLPRLRPLEARYLEELLAEAGPLA